MEIINRNELEITIKTLNKIKDNLEEEIKKGIGKEDSKNCNKVLEYSLIDKLLSIKRYSKRKN